MKESGFLNSHRRLKGRRVRTMALLWIPAALIAVASLVHAGSSESRAAGTGYELNWWTVDGGGHSVSGGGYRLSGSAGQAEPGPPLTGSGYSLTGGFWAGGGAVGPTPVHTATATPTRPPVGTPTSTATGSPPATSTPTVTRTGTPTWPASYLPLVMRLRTG